MTGRRIVSISLPQLAMERWLRVMTRQGNAPPDDIPVVLAREGQHGPVVHAANRAARLAGASRLAIMRRHVLPNIAGLMIVQASVQFAFAILAEAGLSYLGIGTQPPNPSWGRMLNDAQTYLALAPRLALFPGLAIALAVLAFNLLGDGLCDLLDPRLEARG